MNKNNLTLGIVIVAVILTVVFSFVTGSPKKYTNDSAKFSIELPAKWKLVDSAVSSSTSSFLFGNGVSTLNIKKFARDENTNQAIKFFGNRRSEFYVFLVDQLEKDIDGYSPVATSSVMIGDIEGQKVTGEYVGKKTQKKVIQTTYLLLTDSDYYIIGFDVYSDIWGKNKDQVIKSLSSFSLI